MIIKPYNNFVNVLIWSIFAGNLLLTSFNVKASNVVLLPNMNSLQSGESGSVQGGAIVAKVGDASSAVYNPAAIVLSPKNSFSASATSFVSNQISLEGSEVAPTFDSIGSFIGNILKIGEHYFAFSISAPIYTSSNIFNTYTSDLPAYNLNDLSVNESLAGSLKIIAPGVSYAKSLDEKSSVGVTFRILHSTLTLKESVSALSTAQAGGDPYESVFTQNYELSNISARLELGYLLSISKNIRLGASLKSETYQFSSSGSWSYNSLERTQDGSSWFTNANENDVNFNFKIPMEMDLGIAYVGEGFDVELLVSHGRGVSNTKVTSQNISMFEFHRSSDGTNRTYEKVENNFIPQYNFEPVTNYAISFRKSITDAFVASTALYTDYANTESVGENDVFTPVDLYGVALGITKFSKAASTTLGLNYLAGDSSKKFTDVAGNKESRDLTVSSLILILSGSLYY